MERKNKLEDMSRYILIYILGIFDINFVYGTESQDEVAFIFTFIKIN